MASFSFTVCLILSLAAIASADYYTPQSPPVYSSPVKKPTLPPVYVPPVHKPSPVYTPPVHKPSPVYVPPVYTPPVHKPSPVYVPPVYTPPVKKPSPVYTPPVYKPKPETKPPTTYAPPSKEYSPKPYSSSPTLKPYVPKVKITVAIEGVILCKHGYNTYPIIGAKAKLVCSKVDSYGKHDDAIVIYSEVTNEKGYFYLAVTEAVKDINLCKVKLDVSPIATCNNPTNINKGITGLPLSLYHYRFFPDKLLNLYSLSPFYFTGSHDEAPKTKY